jgi:phage terminase large subunit GpA-like protein
MKIERRKAIVGKPQEAQTLEGIVLEAAAAARPPERLNVSEAAAQYRKINNPGSYVGPWKNETVPYLVEPMNVLQSHLFTGMVFAGPAQCGKTDMALNWVLFTAKCDPADMMIVQTSGPTARDFSIRRIDRLHRHSPAIGELLAVGKQGDNTFDKSYKGGMLLTLSWPSINELSGKPIPRLWLTDYDRMPQDIDGEGSPFDLARKRATSFRSFGMCAAESSPGFVVDNPKWVRKSAHEAPPTKGILALYNRGDRRRWYWSCVKCEMPFEPSFELLDYPATADKMEAAETAVLRCPHCRQAYNHEPAGGLPGKHELNRLGRWVPDGMTLMPGGRLVGTAARSTIASFWMKGVAAAFSDWKTLIFNYLSAEEEYESTQSEESLKTTVNTDQGEAYVPKSLKNDRAPETIKARAFDFGDRVVPSFVRFLVASIDVQKNRFVVQVHGVAANKDVYVIDRFEVKKSKRVDEDGEHKWVNPGANFEDWKLLGERVIAKRYPLGDGSDRTMGIRLTVSDSGGREGVTENAYNFVRWLRRGNKAEDLEKTDSPEAETKDTDEGTYEWSSSWASRFLLLKGNPIMTSPRVQLTYPDSQRKDRMAGARGEIPVLLVNSNAVKDMVNNRLDRVEPGARFCFPSWADANFFIELTVEIKDPKKGWINPKRFRNESWDLLAYCLAATLSPTIQIEHLNFRDPPKWAAPWDENDLVEGVDSTKPEGEKEEKPKTAADRLAALAGDLG